MGKRISLSISPGFYILMALALLTIPLRWLFAWIVSAVLHECCHMVAVNLCGGRIHHFALKATGAQMISSPLTSGETVICALAGPMGNMLLLLMGKWFPCLAITSLIQCLFNLLPIEELDGGRALHSALSMILPETMVQRICKGIHWCALIGIAFLLLWDKILVMVFAISLIIISTARISQKFLAKRARKG